jgi:hypothetical protein
MNKNLPPALSVNDAAALILNISYLPGSNDLLAMISHFREEAEDNRDSADNSDDREKYNCQAVIHLCREGLARSMIQAIGHELDALGKGKESILELADSTFGSEKFVTASVLAWAEQIGFGIQGWTVPRHWRKKTERSYSSEYLDIVDDVIATFCEEGGEGYYPGRQPKVESILEYIRNKYGNLSARIVTAIPTIVRPGVSPSTKK